MNQDVAVIGLDLAKRVEPPRVRRRLIGFSYAAILDVSRAA